MTTIGEQIMTRVERKFEKGENFFRARGVMARIALVFTSDELEVIADTNERTVRFLDDKGAEGYVFAFRDDLGNGYEDSTDFVLVTSRDGHPTVLPPAHEHNINGHGIVIRASTDTIDY